MNVYNQNTSPHFTPTNLNIDLTPIHFISQHSTVLSTSLHPHTTFTSTMAGSKTVSKQQQQYQQQIKELRVENRQLEEENRELRDDRRAWEEDGRRWEEDRRRWEADGRAWEEDRRRWEKKRERRVRQAPADVDVDEPEDGDIGDASMHDALPPQPAAPAPVGVPTHLIPISLDNDPTISDELRAAGNFLRQKWNTTLIKRAKRTGAVFVPMHASDLNWKCASRDRREVRKSETWAEGKEDFACDYCREDGQVCMVVRNNDVVILPLEDTQRARGSMGWAVLRA